MKNTYFKFAFGIVLIVLFDFCSGRNNTASGDTTSVIATTKLGKLRGTSQNGTCVWRGISYAKAPVGKLRFKSPVPVDAWAGVKDALQFGPSAEQMKSPFGGADNQSEDCLSLNIWSPAADGKKRPVMLWIHGGGFAVGSGSSPLYDGAHLSQKGDMVIVTINYRLGPLGFLYFNDIAPNNHDFENNLGIKDQIAALKWVKENIAAFGGDPDQVTIFGESAGGTSVEALLATTAAKGLFERAIVESGPPAIVWQPEIGTELTKKYLSFLDVKPDSLQLLKSLPVDTLKSAEEKLLKWMIKDYPKAKVFCPTIDGDLIAKDIFSCISNQQAGNVPLLIGTNQNEANLFARKKLNMVPKDAKGLDEYFGAMSKENKKQIISAYKYYPHKRGILAVVTDGVFTIPTIRLAECQLQHAPVYVYRFKWQSFALKLTGAHSFHGLEIPFVFGNIDNGMGKLLKVIATKKLIHRLTGQMQTAWINFARYGNPNGQGTDAWKKYDESNRSTMIFDKKSGVVSDPDAGRRKAWTGIKYY